jgi:hypothetical protein
MTGPPRDWAKELAEIDKLMAKSPPAAAPPATGPASRSPATPARGAGPPALPAPARGSVLSVWTRVLLGVVLAGAMTQWPYGKQCGTPLFLYTGASAVVGLAGFWAAASSWRRRMGLAHVVALLVTLWGLILVAAIVLPRIGYARAEATWLCP